MKHGSLAMIIMNIAYIFLLRDTHYIKIDQSSHCFIILCWKINVHSFKHKLIMNPLISISFENDCYWRCCCLLQRRAGNIYVVVYCYVYYTTTMVFCCVLYLMCIITNDSNFWRHWFDWFDYIHYWQIKTFHSNCYTLVYQVRQY